MIRTPLQRPEAMEPVRKKPSVPDHLEQESLDTIGSILASVGNANDREKSFVRQLFMLGIFGESDPPDAIFFTTNSAIPMADVFRGIYDAAATQIPSLLPIDGKSCKLLGAVGDTGLISVSQRRAINHRLVGISRTLVVDQYKSSGKTLSGAQTVLEHHGKLSETISGRWYGDANRHADVNIQDMTSTFAEQLHRIGVECFRAYENVYHEEHSGYYANVLAIEPND